MSYLSKNSRSLAESTLQKFLLNVVPMETIQHANSGAKSGAQSVHNQLSTKRMSAEDLARIQKRAKLKRNRHIRQKQEMAKKVNKIAKHHVIKSHKEANTLTAEEQKYLNKVVKRNAGALSRLSEIEDYELKLELANLQEDILAVNKKQRRSKQRLNKDFNDKIKRGKISYPGLTPGLAPVGMDDEDDSDSE